MKDGTKGRLEAQVALLRTPTARLAANGGSQHPDKRKAGGHGPTLADEIEHLLPTPVVTDANGTRNRTTGAVLLPTPQVADSSRGPTWRGGSRSDGPLLAASVTPDQFGSYGPAVRRWETLTRPAPEPREPGKNGQPRLAPRFVEWMMGLPDGWVTNVPGVGRNQQLKALGNGVVPQQAAEALRRWAAWQAAREPAA